MASLMGTTGLLASDDSAQVKPHADSVSVEERLNSIRHIPNENRRLNFGDVVLCHDALSSSASEYSAGIHSDNGSGGTVGEGELLHKDLGIGNEQEAFEYYGSLQNFLREVEEEGEEEEDAMMSEYDDDDDWDGYGYGYGYGYGEEEEEEDEENNMLRQCLTGPECWGCERPINYTQLVKNGEVSVGLCMQCIATF